VIRPPSLSNASRLLLQDASSAFNGGVYNHSNAARNMIDTLRIGRLVDKEKSE
jgi:cytochrome b involved in lipid metabolism